MENIFEKIKEKIGEQRDLTEKEQICLEMAKIEEFYGGFGNIPLKHQYWTLRDKLQGLN